MQLQTLKGFRDFLPQQMRKRQYVIDVLKKSFEKYGFEPLETPALEYDELLAGKYGDEGEKLMYRFQDHGGRKVALRYDQTVPLARVAASHQHDLPHPFKRYQIQPVWRAENTQKGRYREFLQCDADILGSNSALSDAQLLACAADGIKSLGFTQFKILLNDREIFTQMARKGLVSEDKLTKLVTSIDKLKKVGKDGVIKELLELDLTQKDAEKVLQNIEEQKPTDYILTLRDYLQHLGQDIKKFIFEPTLARGLDYYTGLIFEIEIEGIQGSVCGGGRYNNLVKDLADIDTPASGFAYGFDRIVEAMEEKSLFPEDIDQASTQVLVCIFDNSTISYSLSISHHLLQQDIHTEVYDDPTAKIDKQLKYADKKGIPYVAIAGPSEMEKNTITLKNMKSGEQQEMKLDTLTKEMLK